MRFSIDGGSISFGGNVLLEDIRFEIKNSEKIALVGRNGSGKSTLLRLICADEQILEAFDGEKSTFSPDIEIGYLEQIRFDDERITLEEELYKAFSKLLAKKAKMEALLKEIEKGGDPELSEEYAALENDFRINGGYYYMREYETVLKNFGFTETDKKRRLKEFSGGQRTKIAFVKLLLSKPDILLLDEPTNHLDSSTVEWLEEYLSSYPKAIVFVSHDRMFLDKVAQIIYDIDRGQIRRYVGNYSNFRKQKEQLYEKWEKEYRAQEKEIKKEKELIERFRYKATKAAMVQSRIKALEKRELIPPPQKIDLRSFYADISPLMQSASEAVRCKNLEIGYTGPLATVDFAVMRGQKVGVIGANGTGKTTLLKTLVGKLPALGGTYTFGTNAKIGYFDQQLIEFTGQETVLDNYRNDFPHLTETEARSDLAAFLFGKENCFKQVSVLSGGEKVRLSLCKIIKRRPNILLLDEPTNHTDIVGKEALEEMLKSFEGTIICVSHDRYFISNLCDSILYFDGKTARFFDCPYERFKQITDNENRQVTLPEITQAPKPEIKKKRFSPLKELTKVRNKRLKTEEKIALLEEEIDGIKAELLLEENASDYLKLSELTSEIDEKKTELSILMDEWEKLSRQEEELQGAIN